MPRVAGPLSSVDFHENTVDGLAAALPEWQNQFRVEVCRGTNRGPPKLDGGGRGCATPDAATPALCVDANFTIAVFSAGLSERGARAASRRRSSLLLAGRARENFGGRGRDRSKEGEKRKLNFVRVRSFKRGTFARIKHYD